MTVGVGRLWLAASVNAARNLRMPVRTTSARFWNFLSSGNGSESMAARYMCIAASARFTIVCASPSCLSNSPMTPQLVDGVQLRSRSDVTDYRPDSCKDEGMGNGVDSTTVMRTQLRGSPAFGGCQKVGNGRQRDTPV